MELSVAVLVVEGAEAVAVDVLTELDHDMVVDERARIDVLAVASLRVGEIIAVEGGLELVEVVEDIAALARGDLLLLGLDQAEGLPPVRADAAVAGVETVLFQYVAAGDLGRAIVRTRQLRDVNTVGVALDLLHEDVDSSVVTRAHPASRGLEIELDEFAAGAVAADLVAPVIAQVVAHE